MLVLAAAGLDVDGDGRIDEVRRRGDTLAIPSWHALSHAADEDAVILTVSDRPVMEKLGFLREADG